MNKKNKGILIGMIIGDGHLSQRKDKRWNYTSNSIVIQHCLRQKEYLEYIDLFDNEIDMRIISHDATFLYEIPDIFMVKNIPYQTIYYYHNKIRLIK